MVFARIMVHRASIEPLISCLISAVCFPSNLIRMLTVCKHLKFLELAWND